MTTERAKSKIGRWVDETMKGKFDNLVGSRKKSNTNSSTKITETPTITPDTTDEQFDVDLLNSVKPAELHSRMTESVFEDETTRLPVTLTDIDLGVLLSNMTQKHRLEDVNADERDVGKMIQQHLKLLNINSENADENESRHLT